MQNIRSTNTQVELLIARELRKNNIYFAKNVKNILGKPDIVFRRKKIVIFIDSDFWHGHPKRGVKPKSNKKYWIDKIKRNIERDRFVTKELKKAGWTVLRFWEYDIRANHNEYVNKILLRIKN
jgi:DNA mismatch endonuclease (patch repair protein)